ncbi:hypothetical protein M569_16854 [Genlisea aurea]|uniref:Uncharacterized protein n=1 Tax=Genlisea aurea TaxID=192259 RepID=S8D5S1_9LAMI|nr:hypothetical protein M569_16854 [Genlisea aurea]
MTITSPTDLILVCVFFLLHLETEVFRWVRSFEVVSNEALLEGDVSFGGIAADDAIDLTSIKSRNAKCCS